MTTRAAIYLRQSQDRSGKEEGIERQRARCLSLATLRGWDVVEEYVDNDTSATKRRGPGTAWHKLVEDAEAGRVDIIVAVDQDRLLRGLRDLVTLIDLGLKVVTVDGEIDLASADGEFRATMAAGLARFEGRRKAERMRRANEQRRDKGVPTSGRVPYGYKWIPTAERDRRRDPAAYELDGERADVVRDIYEAALGGVPIRSIARDLTLAGHRTTPTKAHPDGVPFRPSTINRMLLSPYYAALLPIPKEGATSYDQNAITRDSCVEGAWPAIVKVEQWEAAKALFATPGRKTSPGPSRKWLLSGLATCGTCGDGIRAGGGEVGIHSYRCRSMAHFMRRGDPLDEYVEALVIARLSRPDAVELLTDRDRPDLDSLRGERVAVAARVASIGLLVVDGTMTEAEAREGLKAGRAKLAAIDAKLVDAGRSDVFGGVVGEVDVAATWAGLSLGRKRAIVEALMSIVVHSVGQGNRRRMSAEAMAKTLTVTWHA